MILLCNLEPKDWLNVVLALIGIFVSGGGLFIAIRQIYRVRTTSEAVQSEVKASQKKIRQTLDSNEIGRAIKSLEHAIDYVSREEYDHALTKLMDVKSIIENDEIILKFLPAQKISDYDYKKIRFNDSFKTIASDIMFPASIDRRMVQNSLVDIHNYLLQVENQIKASVYDRKD